MFCRFLKFGCKINFTNFFKPFQNTVITEEAKKKANEEARLKDEAEAKRKADEEARLKVEAEAKKKTEEETRLKADAEAKKKVPNSYLGAHEQETGLWVISFKSKS